MKRRLFLKGMMGAAACAPVTLTSAGATAEVPTIADAVSAYCNFVVGRCGGAIVAHPDTRGVFEYWPWDLDAERLAEIRKLGAPIYSRLDGTTLVEAEVRRRGWVTAETAREWYWAGEEIWPQPALELARRYCVAV